MLFYYLRSFIFLMLFIIGQDLLADDHIVVEKKNVVHKFVRVDPATDHFTQNLFWNWENETFEIFDKVKDPQGIAIDIGAWIGTTAIWLSKNFHHVIAIEPDEVSLNCLKKNLIASECFNVTICDQPVTDKSQSVIFGPRGHQLNESISYVKNESNHTSDYSIRSITFKQLLFDYVYANEEINSRKIGFIKCDIEGGEENILEDILHFAYYNKCPVYLSFHLSWWQSKNIDEFDDLFKYFKTNCPSENICEYLTRNPFTSLLFEPKENAGILVKKNLPAVIIGYNQLTFIKNMVKQLEKYTSDIIIIDNASTYPPLLEWYANHFPYTLLREKFNFGHTVYHQKTIQKLVGDLYLLTDPDLLFNPSLPNHFIQDFIDIANHFQVGRVGFALCIDSDDIRTDIKCYGLTIKEWESQFWIRKLNGFLKRELEIYDAPIDTTFCLINRTFPDFPRNHVRVAGDYTCFHIPWHKGFQNMLEEGEYDSYLQNNQSTNWFKVTEK